MSWNIFILTKKCVFCWSSFTDGPVCVLFYGILIIILQDKSLPLVFKWENWYLDSCLCSWFPAIWRWDSKCGQSDPRSVLFPTSLKINVSFPSGFLRLSVFRCLHYDLLGLCVWNPWPNLPHQTFWTQKHPRAALTHNISPKPPAFDDTSRGHVVQRSSFCCHPIEPLRQGNPLSSTPVRPRPFLAQGGGQGTGLGHQVPWPLSLKLLLWHCLGCLFLSNCLFPVNRKNILESIR